MTIGSLLRRSTLSAVIGLLGMAQLSQAQSAYIQVDIPGSNSTWCVGINGAGEIGPELLTLRVKHFSFLWPWPSITCSKESASGMPYSC